jgi:hypothetical protein
MSDAAGFSRALSAARFPARGWRQRRPAAAPPAAATSPLADCLCNETMSPRGFGIVLQAWHRTVDGCLREHLCEDVLGALRLHGDPRALRILIRRGVPSLVRAAPLTRGSPDCTRISSMGR